LRPFFIVVERWVNVGVTVLGEIVKEGIGIEGMIEFLVL
jgi:hypothetical protein